MSTIIDLLGTQAGYYLDHVCKTIDKKLIHIPEPNMIDKAWVDSDRNIRTLESLQALYGHGRLANTGYVSILPVDQGIEHSAGASFAPNPLYFDPGNIVKLAIEGGCNAVASTFGVLGAVARKYAHKIPFIVKLNHNELLTYPNSYDQVMFGTVKEAWNMGAVAVGATIYFGSEQSRRQIVEVSQAFEYAHELGMATVLWTEHSAPLSLRAQHSEDPAQNPHQQDKPCPDELHRFPLALVQCTQNEKQASKERSFRCAPDESLALLQNGHQQAAEKAAETDCCRGQRSSGLLRQALFDHQPAEPCQAHGCCRTAHSENDQQPYRREFLGIRHKNAPPCTYCMQGDAFKARIRKNITSWGRCPCSASRQS